MHSIRRAVLLGALTLAAACSTDNFLSGGELSTDPNRPVQATSAQLLVGIQVNLWAELESDPARVTGMWAQQLLGTNVQYVDIYNYGVSEQVTNGFHTALYTGGGLVDIRRLQAQTIAAKDTVFRGIAEVIEGLLMGTGADLFGDLTYSHALTNERNPPLDPQLAVYDSVQAVLSRGIEHLKATGPTNIGPGQSDLAYGGDPVKWTKLAHTLKARFLMHTAEVRPTVYPQVVAEAVLGLTVAADNFNAVFSGATNEQNFWYQFDVVQRPGYIAPNDVLVGMLKTRNDPRLAQDFNSDQSDLSDALISKSANQALVTANESLLLWAEAAQRAGNNAAGLTRLNQARALAGLPAEAAGLTGRPLLAEILAEEYIADFQSIEVWNLYKRTCTPNLVPVVAGLKIPARYPYDAAERNTNTNIPPLSQQPFRNANDPANATSDATGAACLGQ